MKGINYKFLSKKYPDRWIALESKSGKVVGVGETAKVAYEQAQKRGIKEPLLTKVPKHYGYYILENESSLNQNRKNYTSGGLLVYSHNLGEI